MELVLVCGVSFLGRLKRLDQDWWLLKMSGVFSQRQLIASWNSVNGVWVTDQVSLLCGHWGLFSATWPASGLMQGGLAFELPMPVRHITVLESSLLRSPKASEGQGGALGEAEALRRGNTVGVRDQVMDLVAGQGVKVSRADLLPTPRAQEPGSTSAGYGDGLNDVTNRLLNGFAPKDLLPTPNTMEHREIKTPEQIAELKAKSPGGYRNLRESVVNELLPTPKALDGVKGNLKSSQERLDSGHQIDLPNIAIDLLGTPRTSAANGSSSKQVDAGAPKARIEDQVLTTNWGKFEPAIRRWEEVIGRSAPAPTKPDGKDGAHRLSSAFTEWMMGVPEGWITDCGLTRNEELKACGNGVVPQQAELALRYLLEGIGWQEREREKG